MSFSEFSRLSLDDHKNGNGNYSDVITPNSRESIGSRESENLNTSQRSFGSYCRNLTPLQNHYMLNGRTSIGQFNQQSQQRFSCGFEIDQLNFQEKQIYQNNGVEGGGFAYFDLATPSRFSNSSNSGFNMNNFHGTIGQSSLNAPTFGNAPLSFYDQQNANPFLQSNIQNSNRPSMLGDEIKEPAHFGMGTNQNSFTSPFELLESNFLGTNNNVNNNINISFNVFTVPNRGTVMKQAGQSEIITLMPQGTGGSSSIGGIGANMRSNGGSMANRNSSFTRVSRGQGSDMNGMSFETFNFEPIDINGVALNTSAGKNDFEGQSQMGDEESKNIGENPVFALEGCSCQKSKCLQLYCECFSNSQQCQPYCKCFDCRNKEEFSEDVENARRIILQKNPAAFNSKLEILGNMMLDQDEGEKDDFSSMNQDMSLPGAMMGYQKGCNCKKTLCRKKYCECFNAGVKCSYLCQCEGCLNCTDDASQLNYANDEVFNDLKREQMEEESRGTQKQQFRKLSEFDEEVNLAQQEFIPQRKYSQRLAAKREINDVPQTKTTRDQYTPNYVFNIQQNINTILPNSNIFNQNQNIKDEFFINSEERTTQERFD